MASMVLEKDIFPGNFVGLHNSFLQFKLYDCSFSPKGFCPSSRLLQRSSQIINLCHFFSQSIHLCLHMFNLCHFFSQSIHLCLHMFNLCHFFSQSIHLCLHMFNLCHFFSQPIHLCLHMFNLCHFFSQSIHLCLHMFNLCHFFSKSIHLCLHMFNLMSQRYLEPFLLVVEAVFRHIVLYWQFSCSMLSFGNGCRRPLVYETSMPDQTFSRIVPS